MNAAGVKVNIGKDSEVIFGKDMAEHTADFLRQELGEDSVAKYAFARSCETHRIAREKGKQAVRFCPLMIRLRVAVRAKMGYSGGLYDLVAKIAGLPSDRTLRRCTVPTSDVPDGIMHGCIERALEVLLRFFPGIGMFDYKRHGDDGQNARSRTRRGRHQMRRPTALPCAVFDEVVHAAVGLLRRGTDRRRFRRTGLPL